MLQIRYGKYNQQNFLICHRNTYHTKWQYAQDPGNTSWFYFNPTYINRTGENVVDMFYYWDWGGKHQLWAYITELYKL